VPHFENSGLDLGTTPDSARLGANVSKQVPGARLVGAAVVFRFSPALWRKLRTINVIDAAS
jgi:hypothetical protein